MNSLKDWAELAKPWMNCGPDSFLGLRLRRVAPRAGRILLASGCNCPPCPIQTAGDLASRGVATFEVIESRQSTGFVKTRVFPSMVSWAGCLRHRRRKGRLWTER